MAAKNKGESSEEVTALGDSWEQYFGGKEPAAAIRDGILYLRIEELLASAKVSRGDYNKNQSYTHVRVVPAVPWAIRIPVGEMSDLEALKRALEGIHDVATEVARAKADELERAERQATRAAAQRSVGTDASRGSREALHNRDASRGSREESGVSVSTPIKTIETRPGVRSGIDAATDGEPEVEDDF